MADKKLSYTARQIDYLLGKIKDMNAGGTGTYPESTATSDISRHLQLSLRKAGYYIDHVTCAETQSPNSSTGSNSVIDYFYISDFAGGTVTITGMSRGQSSVFLSIYNGAGTVLATGNSGNNDERTETLSIPQNAAILKVNYDSTVSLSGTFTYASSSSSESSTDPNFPIDSASSGSALNQVTPNPTFVLTSKKVLLSGASISMYLNGFFEYAMNKLGLTGTNISDNGANPSYLAHYLYTNSSSIQAYDILLISHVHNRDVYTLPESLASYNASDYESDSTLKKYISTAPSNDDNDYRYGAIKAIGSYTVDQLYAAMFDYCIKKWYEICNVKNVRPQIGLFTYWHDARVKYNTSVRLLAKKWGQLLIADDINIGFSKEEPDALTGAQFSVAFAETGNANVPGTETIDGVVYGWHPARLTQSQYNANVVNGAFNVSALPEVQRRRFDILVRSINDSTNTHQGITKDVVAAQDYNESLNIDIDYLDIVNNLTEGGSARILSAEQGKVLNAKISQNTNRINELSGTVTTNDAEITSLKGDVNDLADQGNVLNAKISQNTNRINELSGTVTTNDAEITSLKSSQDALAIKLDTKPSAWCNHENTLYAFDSVEKRDQFKETLDTSLVLDGFDPVPIGAGGGGGGGGAAGTIDMRIQCSDTGKYYVNGDQPCFANVFVKSVYTEDGVEKAYDNEVNLEILVKLNGMTSNYSIGRIMANENVQVNITPYIANGAVVRFKAYNDDGYSRTTTGSWSVVRATMQIGTANESWWANAYVEGADWQVPLVINSNVDCKIVASLKDGGGVTRSSKTVTDFTENYNLQLSHPITAGGASGVYTLKVELICTNADLTGIETQTIDMKVFCVSESDTNNYVIVNNNVGGIKNYTTNHVFDVAVRVGYGNPLYEIKAYDDSNAQIAATGSFSLSNGDVYQYNLALQQERIDNADFNVTVKLFGGATVINTFTYVCDNKEGYAATAGATMLIRFDGRNNNSSDRAKFYNTMNGGVITPTVSGVNYSNADGYKTETTDGTIQSFFRILAGGQVTLPIKPLAMASNDGRTLEIDYRVNNVLDPDTTVIKCMVASGNSYNGLKVTPDSVCVLAPSATTADDQTAGTDDSQRMRIAIVVRPLAQGATATVDTFSGIFIFINGCLQKEFAYGKDLNVDANLVFGSADADVDIFAIRTYNAALTKKEIETNACNLQPTEADKISYKSRNNVRENNAVSFNLCRSMCNVIVFETDVLPARSWDKTQKTNAKVSMYHAGGTATDYSYDVTDFTWQGTTSHNYSTADGVGQNYKWGHDGRKYCAKANWASSMQSHKIALTAAYTDLAVKCGVISDGTRISILQEPAVGFWKHGDTYQFIGLFTVGCDKGDKTLFGFDGDCFAMEGKDNEPLGTNFLLPWNDDCVTVDSDGENYSHCGVKSWEDSLKKTANVASRWKPAFNFVYECNQMIAPHDGDLSTLAADLTGKAYWLTSTYQLYYYNSVSKSWKDSGINLIDSLVTGKNYGLTAADITAKGDDYDAINELFLAARRAKFKAEVVNYFDVDDAIYHQCFTEFFASSDNLSKNTYPYMKACSNSASRIKWRQDDLDSSLETENQGKSYKMYCVEIGDNYSSYGRTPLDVFNGTHNQFWALLRTCFADEIYAFMRDKFIPATHYGSGNAMTAFTNFCKHYFFDNAQEHFSEALYNENSRVRYEAASLESGYDYSNLALSQNCGSAYDMDKKWLKMRYIYMSSKYTADNFSAGNVYDVFVTRPYNPEDDDNYQGNTYQITPAIYMYPSVQNGQSVIRGERIYPASENKTWNAALPKTQGDQEQRINGISYIKSLGDIYKVAIRGNVNVNGKMLTVLKMGSKDDAGNIKVKITGLAVGDATALRTLDMANLTTLQGVSDLTACTNLRTLYADNTNVTSISLCEGGALNTLHLPASITSLPLIGKKEMEDMVIGGGANIISIDVEDCNSYAMGVVMDILTQIYSD